MNKKVALVSGLVFIFFFLFIFFTSLASSLETYSESNLWGIDYSDVINYDVGDTGFTDKTDKSFFSSFLLKDGIIDTSLPGESHLTVRGRKVIGVKYTRFNYFSPEARESKPTSTTEVEQKLQIHARGKIGRKIFVNLDYDDSAPRTQQQKISLVYKGDEGEIIREVALGDITLSLPKTNFTSYNKSLFGARIKAKWGDFYLTGIGSVTRGISEVKTFTGKTTTEEKNIPDTGYIKRTYFKIFFDQKDRYPPEYYGPFSYTQGSLEVWVDDQNGSNNVSGVTTHMTVIGEPIGGATDTYTGYFDLQYPGQDYTVDYPKGMIKFNKQVGEQYVIALAYRDADGERHPSSGYYMIMKGPDENYYKYRLWNYYYLGSQRISQDGFTLQIKDLSGNVVYDFENPGSSVYKVNVDFDFGIAQVTKPTSPVTCEVYYRPFPNAYPPTSSHYYTIYTKYTHTVDVYLLHPDIIPGSERVYVDGKLLSKDKDYTIDYPSGYLSFLNPDLIGPDTKIRVEYEWAPLMGGQATFLGGRLEYRPSDNFSVGSTYLSEVASSPGKIPSLGSTPASHKVWEADLNLSLKPNLGSLWGGNFPLDILLAGEVSQSNVNPNTFGACMVEDFSTTRIEDNLSCGEDSWRLGSIPSGVSPDARDEISISDEEVQGDEVNPSWSSDKITVLDLSCDFGSGESWDSVTYSLSPVGKDYSNMKYLEIWAKGITGSVEVYVDVGLVSEDIDGDGKLDTEDKNGDGILNPGEDTGIVMNFPSGDKVIGAGNGKLDTEDLDGDGILDSSENFSTYFLNAHKEQVPGSNWCKYTISLEEDVFAGQDWDSVKSLVKDVRIWMKGSDFSGKIKFAKISFLGDRWQTNNVKIKSVNNYDDIDFPDPFESSDFRNYYERMYGDTKTSEGKWQKEGALSFLALSDDTGYIQQTFISTKSFADYRKINFWIYLDTKGESEEGEFHLKFGSDVETDYYEYTLPLSSVTTDKWVEIGIPFSELEVEGDPTFNKINQIRIGLNGEIHFPVYIDDIYLSKVYEKRGKAQRYFVRTGFSKYFTLSAEYKKISPPFSVIGSSSTNQKTEVKKWGLSSSFLDFLPFSYSRSEKYTSNLTTRGIDLTPVEEDKVFKRSQSYRIGFRLRSLPTISFSGSNVTSDYLSKEPFERTSEDTYDLSLNYPVPLSFPILPTNISLALQLKKSGKEVKDTSSTMDVTKKGSIVLPFRPLPNMVMKTSYSQSETNTSTNGGEKLPKARSKGLSLSCQLSVLRLNPRIEFKGSSGEDTFSSSDPGKRKVSTNLDISSSLPFRPAAFLKLPDIFSTVGWYLSFKLKREGIYENTSVLLDPLSQFGFSRLHLEDGTEKLWLEKRTFSLKQTWNPFPFLATTVSYTEDEEDRTELGTPYVILTETWPVVNLKFDLNRTPLLIDRLSKRFFSSSNLVFGYSRKNTVKEKISTTTSFQPSLNWKGVFKKPDSLSVSYSYKSTTQNVRNFGEEASSIEFSSTHQLKLSWSTYAPWGLRIPILNRIINFKNRITLSTTLSREAKYERNSSGVVGKDQEKWTLGTDVSSRVTENINMKFGLNAAYYEDRVKVGESYFSYGGSIWMEIFF